ncbi:hypothetical protein PpBr36_02394 [Pyricularia pennisetigena]|uniref:hypothetical protein n=1 Tax=Pyricularia pennisetigena TaxID=1578925 RepID=UPI001153027A|nr:hypothetical protein PpBr36_02394 [Pyricularia pennisetigena]TLS31437.1 hypothetical protein PpBr36_02394 [Pyricularia pennisetigena]
MLRISYWILPIISGVVWLATLLGLLLNWTVNENRIHYGSMSENQTIAYISDAGAYRLKPLFITGCVITTIFLDAGFLADRWLRHKGRLVPNSTMGEKILSGLTIAFAVVGTVGLIMLSIFDTASHNRLHNIFLSLFIGGYTISAIFICWEYQRLGRNRDHRVLRTSFWIKLVFIIVEILLCVGFGIANRLREFNAAAILEWVIAVVFSFYVFSFYVDLYPAVYTKNGKPYTRPLAGGAFRTKGMAEPPMAQRYRGGSASATEEGRIESDSTAPGGVGAGAGGGPFGTGALSHTDREYYQRPPVPQNF